MAGTPPGQVHSRAGTPSNAGWYTVNKRAVHILLECILVTNFFTKCILHETLKTRDIMQSLSAIETTLTFFGSYFKEFDEMLLVSLSNRIS